ncbi:MAG: hypothetical protein DRN27_09220 [Thermoplasmata archaeon]|nr:MAG: hypothetical protein DRN27_09220 [Thermoplasmata archaeon]
MVNLRKLFYYLNAEQKTVLLADIKRIAEGCNYIASTEWKELKESQKTHDGQCPKCRVSVKIIDKIRHVQGTGKISSDFKLGFGSINGSINIDTTEVNHCKMCGHEWKKFKIKYISTSDIVRVALNYLGEIHADPEKNKRKDWKHDAVKVFNDCHAEAINMLLKKHSGYMHDITKKTLNLKTLRKQYNSVFDENIIIEIKKYGN